jgi:hypothetical protein
MQNLRCGCLRGDYEILPRYVEACPLGLAHLEFRPENHNDRAVEHRGDQLLGFRRNPRPSRGVRLPPLPFPTKPECEPEDLDVWQAQTTVATRGADNGPRHLTLAARRLLRPVPQEPSTCFINLVHRPRRETIGDGDVHWDGQERGLRERETPCRVQ